MKKVKLLALFSAVATALLLFIFLNSLSKPSDTIKTAVLVAAANIPANTSITAEMVTLNTLPLESIIPDALTNSSMAIGKIAEAKIFVGEQVLSSKLISAGGSDSKTLAYAIEPGMRAITIAVDETAGLSYMILPGNHIDVIGDFLKENGVEKISYTAMVLENITVLAVDSVLSKGGKATSETPQYTALTLEVTPEQAMQLSMAQFEGELRTILRSPVDEKATDLPNLTLDNILLK